MSPDLNITAEQLKLFEEFYRRRLAEAGGVRDDAEELAVARDILQAVVNDGLTPTLDGGASFVRRGARDWSDPTTVQAAQATATGGGREAGQRQGRQKKRRAAAPAAAGGPGRSKEMLQGLGMLAAVLAIAGWFLWPMLFGSEGEETSAGRPGTGAAAQAAEVEGTGKAFSEKDEAIIQPGTPVPTLQAELLADIVDAGGVKTGPVVPRTLEIKGVSYIVQPVVVQAGDWPPPEDPRAASWVYGTVVNYVLGLEATPENKELLASLKPGDELLLRMSTGPTYRFAYADAVRVSPQASEIFGQTRPGLLLALLGDQEQAARVVIRAIYLPGRSETTGGEAAPVTVISPGETHQVGEALRLTCLGAQPRVPSGVAPGYVHLELSFVVENRLEEALVTQAFAHQIIVADLTYPALPRSSAGQSAGRSAGAHPELPATLTGGQVFTTTAVYAIPETALKEELLWQFAPDPAGQAIQVLLPPYEGTLAPTVSITSIKMEEGGLLLLELALQAPDLHPLELGATDVTFEGGALAPGGNTFPWRLAAGERDNVALYLVPDHSPVTVGLLGQGFEISWRESQ